MQYQIVKQEEFYVIVVEGQSLMKLKSRRKAVALLAAVLELKQPIVLQTPRKSATAGGGASSARASAHDRADAGAAYETKAVARAGGYR